VEVVRACLSSALGAGMLSYALVPSCPLAIS